jgi:hypothetical protein
VLCKPSLVFYASRKVFFFSFLFGGVIRDWAFGLEWYEIILLIIFFFFDGSGSLSPGGFGFAAELVNCFGGKCNVL